MRIERNKILEWIWLDTNMDNRIIKQYKKEQEQKLTERKIKDRIYENFTNSKPCYEEIADMKSALEKVRKSRVTHNQDYLSATGSTRNTD